MHDRHGGGSGRRSNWPTLSVIVACQFAYLTLVMSRSWFYADDFINLAISRESRFGWSFLSRDIFGHFAPGHRAIDAFIESRVGLRWWFVMLLIALMLCALTICLMVLVGHMTPETAAITPFIAFAAVSPLLVPSAIWLAAALHSIPAMLFATVALLGAVLHRENRRAIGTAVYVCSLAAALCFYEKPAFVPLTAFALLTLMQAEGSTISRAIDVLRRQWVLWLASAVLLVAYTGIVASGDYDPGTSPPSLGTWASWSRQLFTDGPLLGLLGGSTRQYHGATGAALRVVLLAILVGGVALARHYGFAVGRAVAFVGIATLPGLVATAYGRAGLFDAGIVGDFRYSIELLPLAVIGVALAVRLRGETRTQRHPTRLTKTVAGGTAILLLLLSLVTGWRTVDAWPARSTERWYETARSSVRELSQREGAPVAVCNDNVPFAVLSDVFDPYSRYSRVLTIEPELQRLLLFVDSGAPWCFAEDGTLVPAAGT